MITDSNNKVGAGHETVAYSGTCCNCGGSCLLKLHVRDGVITRIESDDGEEPQLRACVRCRAYRQRIYAPDRLLYPMKRVGERGQGKFERISWDDALETTAREYLRIKDSYGPAAVFFLGMGGDSTLLNARGPVYRVLCLAGGCSLGWGAPSFEAAVFASSATYGEDVLTVGNAADDYVNSRLVILWGINPAETIQGNGTAFACLKAREAGARFVVVDARFTNTAVAIADQWIAIRPGTDTAVMLAMAYVIITENLHDRKFLDTYTVGFEQFKKYVLGEEDGVPKIPVWAEPISGVSAQTIADLAREYANSKPAALVTGWGPGRSAMGEQFHRAAHALAAMTGNIGIHGGNSGGSNLQGMPVRLVRLGRMLTSGKNPVEASSPMRYNALKASGTTGLAARVHNSRQADAMLRGKAGGYPSDYKMLYLVNYNWLNQMPNVNKAVQALKSLEFVAVQEQFMTASARFADIVLPTCTFLERNDVGMGPVNYSYMTKVIEPLGESRSQLDIATGLAKALGVTGFNDKTEDEWLRLIVKPSVPDYDRFREAGIYKIVLSEPYVALKEQIEDPEHHRFNTPSGKIEIYSQEMADMNDPMIPPIPKYIPTWEGVNDPLSKKYPLQLITTHPKLRAHSQFGNIPWLKELEPQMVTINSADARARGIKNGDLVRVFNDRGQMIIPAKVTERIMPGVVDVPEGAWYAPDEDEIDRGGCANVLTRDQASPIGALSVNTALVEIKKA